MNYNDQFWVSDNPANANSNDLFEQAKAYDLGIGVKQDKQKAASLYREAMNQGDKKAKHNLALLYIMQEGESDNVLAGIQMLQELATGDKTKTVYLPYEATNLMGSIGGIKDLFKTE
jgi:TPR repeat protein